MFSKPNLCVISTKLNLTIEHCGKFNKWNRSGWKNLPILFQLIENELKYVRMHHIHQYVVCTIFLCKLVVDSIIYATRGLQGGDKRVS